MRRNCNKRAIKTDIEQSDIADFAFERISNLVLDNCTMDMDRLEKKEDQFEAFILMIVEHFFEKGRRRGIDAIASSDAMLLSHVVRAVETDIHIDRAYKKLFGRFSKCFSSKLNNNVDRLYLTRGE